jgi:predicted anti-sigma-YlaC factor YlaD
MSSMGDEGSKRQKRLQVKVTAIVWLCVTTAMNAGCSLKKMAVGSVSNILSEGAVTYASDDDPELVAQALPFGLKMIETLLIQNPTDRGLLLSAASGYTQYGYAFVQLEADELEDHDLIRAIELRERARRLYLRARDYGLRGLEASHAGFAEAVRSDPRTAVRRAKREDIALMYWTAASWGSAISVSKHLPDLVADQLIVEALLDRALELDAEFDHGAVHGALIGYEFSRQGWAGDPAERARGHFERVVELTGGQSAAPFVSLAENVAVRAQDREAFERLLHRALEVDVDARPEWRLVNTLMHRRARWLLRRVDGLFVGEVPTRTVIGAASRDLR